MSRPRIRTIKPEMWHDEKVGDLSLNARLLFVGLITLADDEGRLRELPSAIIGHTFPYDEISATKLVRWLKEIEATGMLVRYEVGGKRYAAFRRWTRHQKVDKPNPSLLPPPPSFDDDSSNSSEKDRRSVDDHSRLTRERVIDPDPDPGPSRKDARACFAYWQERCKHPAAKFTDERRRKIEARLNEGYSVEQIRLAIDGAARSPYINDQGQRFDDIELICRSGSKLENFVGRASLPAASVAAVSHLPESHRPTDDHRAQIAAHLQRQHERGAA